MSKSRSKGAKNGKTKSSDVKKTSKLRDVKYQNTRSSRPRSNALKTASKLDDKTFQDGQLSEKPKVMYGRAIYYCHVCNNQILLTRAQLREHFTEHGMHEAVKSAVYYRRARAKRNRVSIPSVYPCEICSEHFTNQPELDEHLTNHDDQFFCDICNAGFKLLIDHACHMQEHSEDKLFRCPLCEFKAEKASRIKLHLYAVHEQFKKFKCEICGKGFSLLSYLEEHKNFHTGEKPFQCDVCGLSFMYTRYLKAHKSQRHPEEPRKKLECIVCQKSYNSKKSYNAHIAYHHSDNDNFVCDNCGKSFKTTYGLRVHYKLHSDVRPYKCKYCEMSFKQSRSKVDHERIHTGVKPHQCPVCGKAFTQRTPMVQHWRKHAEKESYSCYTCMKEFVTKPALVDHVKICRHLKSNL